jgi:cytochrome oxidase Cu insertion factor (SCO1/SenC/PrrC family)
MMLLAGLSAALTVPGQAQEFDRPSSSDESMTTGPAVGERIPDFAGIDQHGKRLSWSEIKGPNGALILFYRSADW